MKKEKICLFCGEGFKGGRSDRKYCDDQCRANYHNQQRQVQEAMVININAILKRNWKILKLLNPRGQSIVRKSFLLEQGYNFNYFTNVYKTQEGRVYYFCYDLGFAIVERSQPVKLNIVNWQPYMKAYQLPLKA